MKTPPTCCARVGTRMPSWAPRRNAKCSHAPLHEADLRVDGELVVLSLCGLHYGLLVRSPNPAALARQWATQGDRS